MGMYTGLRVSIMLKNEVVAELQALIDDGAVGWENMKTNDPFRKKVYEEWSKIGRSCMIPFGGLAYMPWDEDEPIWQNCIVNTLKGYRWNFQCSLKNYEDEIESFFKIIMPIITKESLHIEYIYEEDDKPTMYEFRDGAVVRLYT